MNEKPKARPATSEDGTKALEAAHQSLTGTDAMAVAVLIFRVDEEGHGIILAPTTHPDNMPREMVADIAEVYAQLARKIANDKIVLKANEKAEANVALGSQPKPSPLHTHRPRGKHTVN